MDAPGIGSWQRGEEHESMMRFDNPVLKLGFTVHASSPLLGGPDYRLAFVRWLVESLQVWPHPNAPRSQNEYDYPRYRQEQYAALNQSYITPPAITAKILDAEEECT